MFYWGEILKEQVLYEVFDPFHKEERVNFMYFELATALKIEDHLFLKVIKVDMKSNWILFGKGQSFQFMVNLGFAHYVLNVRCI